MARSGHCTGSLDKHDPKFFSCLCCGLLETGSASCHAVLIACGQKVVTATAAARPVISPLCHGGRLPRLGFMDRDPTRVQAAYRRAGQVSLRQGNSLVAARMVVLYISVVLGEDSAGRLPCRAAKKHHGLAVTAANRFASAVGIVCNDNLGSWTNFHARLILFSPLGAGARDLDARVQRSASQVPGDRLWRCAWAIPRSG